MKAGVVTLVAVVGNGFVGADDPEFGDHGKVFMAGFLDGFLGDAEHIKACAGDSMKVLTDVQHFVADIKERNFNKTIEDLQAMVTDTLDDVQECTKIGTDLAPFMDIFKDVHGIKDIVKKVEDNFLAHDKQILDIVEDMLEVCTFGSPDAHKCGEDAGKQMRALVVSDMSVSEELEAHGKIFLSGFFDGLLGDATHIKACMNDSAKVGKDAGQLFADLKAREWEHALQDVMAFASDAVEDVKVCKDIGKDLKPFIGAAEDVHSIKDIMNALKKNFLKHDKEILDILEDMVEVCTFGSPDAHKCGEDAGKQVRTLLVGDAIVV